MESATTLSPSQPGPPSALRVVLDTNAALDLWAFQDPRARALRLDLEAGRLDWPATSAMRLELQRVLERGVGAGRGSGMQAVLEAWDRHARLVTPAQAPPAAAQRLALRCRDPDDQKFLDLALETSAGWLLTADRDLLTLRRRAGRDGLRIVHPGEWPGAAVLQGGGQG